MAQKVEEILAWIATDEEGNEGIPAVEKIVQERRMMLPLIGADFERLISLRPDILRITVDSQRHMKLVRYKPVEVVEELTIEAAFNEMMKGLIDATD